MGWVSTQNETAVLIRRHMFIMSNQDRSRRDFPGGALVKNPPADAGGTGSIPGQGRSHMLRSN